MGCDVSLTILCVVMGCLHFDEVSDVFHLHDIVHKLGVNIAVCQKCSGILNTICVIDFT